MHLGMNLFCIREGFELHITQLILLMSKAPGKILCAKRGSTDNLKAARRVCEVCARASLSCMRMLACTFSNSSSRTFSSQSCTAIRCQQKPGESQNEYWPEYKTVYHRHRLQNVMDLKTDYMVNYKHLRAGHYCTSVMMYIARATPQTIGTYASG